MATATSWTDVYAIFKAYPNVVRVNQDEGCFDKDDIKIEVDQDNVNAARVELDKTKYQVERTGQQDPKYPDTRTTNTIYPSYGEQFDLLFKAIDADSDLKSKFADFHSVISAVKTKYPKPS